MQNYDFIVSGGGTGGHIIPALALSRQLTKSGYTVLFIGNKNGMEEKICLENKIPFYAIDVQKLYRKITLRHILFPLKLIKSVIDCVRIIIKVKPSAFIGTGGFVCGPAGLASVLAGIPLFLQEQNSFPGITTRFLAFFAKKVYLGFPDESGHFNSQKAILSGNPILTDRLKSQDKIDFNLYNLNPDTKKILVIGGSQGSLFINQLIMDNLDQILNSGYELIWQTGKNHLSDIKEKIKDRKGIYCFDFTSEMYKIYNSVDMVIGRAGAIVMAEIETKKLPAILIPLPTAAGNHQYYNALEFQKKGQGLVLEQKNKTGFTRTFEYFVEKQVQLKENFRQSLHQDSAEFITGDLLNYLGKKV